jgi:hypothetical protein
LDDILSAPTLNYTCSPDPLQTEQRLIKAITTQNLIGTQAETIINSASSTNYSQYDLDLVNTDDQTTVNQFAFPPFPALPASSGNFINFDQNSPVALYLDHSDLFSGSTESTNISFAYERDNAEIRRDFSVEVSCP